jgi:uncharacterized membrane protein YesL
MPNAFRYLRAAVSEFYFDLPRMVVINLIWFAFSLPFIFVAYALVQFARTTPLTALGPYIIFFLPLAAISLVLAGPATAGVYLVTNRLAHGDLAEFRQFWVGFRRFLWRAWLLALADVGAGTLLAINIWFYWSQGSIGLRLLAVVFAYLLVFWFMIQSYLFGLLVEMDQSVVLVVRNALFMAIDNLGLTLGMAIVNLIVVALSIPLGALLLPLGTMAILSGANNKAVVNAVDRYRESGRIIAGDRPTDAP